MENLLWAIISTVVAIASLGGNIFLAYNHQETHVTYQEQISVQVVENNNNNVNINNTRMYFTNVGFNLVSNSNGITVAYPKFEVVITNTISNALRWTNVTSNVTVKPIWD